MTIRDIGSWASETYQAFLLDLDFAVTASPLDWPLYMVALAVIFVFFAMVVFGVVLCVPIVLWQEYWKRHFDLEGTPTTGFGKIILRLWDAVFLASIFFLLWIFVGFFVALIAPNGNGYAAVNDTTIWTIFVLPTLAASVFLYLVKRGRASKAKGASSSGGSKSKS